MPWYGWLIIGITFFILCFLKYTSKYRNPYKLIMVFGKKGSGKTTLITKLARQALKKGKQVYSTVYIPGCRAFDVTKVGLFNFPEESVVFIDEVGMIWDNRQYKDFKPHVRDWFKLQRHNRVTVYLFSQTFDVDVKLRNLTDYMYLVVNHFGVLSIARKIKRGIVIVNPDGQSEARIADSLEFESFWLSLFGLRSQIWTWIPHWTKYFDSFEIPQKPPMPFIEIPDIEDKKRRKKHDRSRMVIHRLRKKHNRDNKSGGDKVS
ncbi:MAG: hypothetical protein NC123_04395 [Butyrivibrio sp.]|nr:hypothetical protein [Acetatifactor muris]MCM1558768.1 hypothetical protein [Butyrivibrio sp.]